jgi:hypothetical protein
MCRAFSIFRKEKLIHLKDLNMVLSADIQDIVFVGDVLV